MGKSNAKLITASETVKGLIDRGFEVDVQIKNLGFEDKGIKKMLADELESSFEDDSTSVRVEGADGAAIVSQFEKYTIDGDAEELAHVEDIADKGFLGDALKVAKVLNIPTSDLERAEEVLREAGIDASLSAKISVSPPDYRALKDRESVSVEETAAYNALSKLINRSVSFRIKYEKV